MRITSSPSSDADDTVNVPHPSSRSRIVYWKDTSLTFDSGMSLPLRATIPVRVMMRRLVKTYCVVSHVEQRAHEPEHDDHQGDADHRPAQPPLHAAVEPIAASR